MKTSLKLSFLLFGFVLISVTSCYYDVEEELYPINTCDTTNVTYSGHVSAVLTNNCLNCHNTSNAQFIGGGIVLDSYANLKTYVDNGKFLSSITHDGNASFMPQSVDNRMLPACDISKIQAWINAGSPNN